LQKQQKEELAGQLAHIFQQAKMGILLDYRGMKVEEISELRSKLRQKAGYIRVLKNRVAKRAVKGTPFEPIAEKMTDTRALVYGQDPVGQSKVVNDYLATHEKVKMIAALLVKDSGGELLDASSVKRLATLPSREELVAKLLFLMNAPVTRLARTLNEVPAGLVRALDAIAKQKSA